MASFIPRRVPRGKRVWQAHIRRRGYPAQVRTFDSKAAARSRAAGIEHEMSQGSFVSRFEAEETTLCELLDRHEHEMVPEKRVHRGSAID